MLWILLRAVPYVLILFTLFGHVVIEGLMIRFGTAGDDAGGAAVRLERIRLAIRLGPLVGLLATIIGVRGLFSSQVENGLIDPALIASNVFLQLDSTGLGVLVAITGMLIQINTPRFAVDSP